jgi:hypothetical protein
MPNISTDRIGVIFSEGSSHNLVAHKLARKPIQKEWMFK